MGSGKPPLPPPSATPETKKPPLPAPNSKKKDVAGASQTSPSTPSPSGQMPGFIQLQRLDVNAAPSISPSTPHPVSNKPAQLPNFIYNNNLNTGTKPSGRGDFSSTARAVEENKYNQAQSPTSNIVGYNVWDQYAAYGYDPNPAPIETEEKKIERQTARLNMYADLPYTYKQQFDKIQLENASVRANTPGTPEYQTKVAAQYPGVAVAPVIQEQNTLDKAREFSDWYLLNTNPSLYNDLKNPVKYYSQEQEPSLTQSIITSGSAAVDDYTRSFALQTARATYDTYSLNNYTKAANRSLEINKSFLDSTYGPQKLAYDSAYDTLMAWPKDPNGNYIANTPEEQTKWSETMNTYKLLMSDEGFVSAMQAVDKDYQDLAAADSAYKQVIRENPLFFIAQDQAKQRSAEEQARLSQLGPVFEWKAKNIDNPAAMAIVDAAIGFAYLPKAFGEGDEFGWTDDLYYKASIGRELMVIPSLPVEDSIVSKFVSSAVTMGIMVGTGYAAGAALGGSELALMAGQAAAGTVTTMEGYYRAGKEAGMSDSDAESYSIVSGLIQGMLEMVNPEAAFGASVTKKSASEYMRILAEGGTKSFARKEATKEIFRNIAAENVQELMQQMAEWGINMKANQITGANLDVGEKWGKTVAETALITTLISGIVGGVNASSIPNRLGAEATYAAGLDPETYRSRTASMVVDGQISTEKAAEINDKINTAERIVSKIPSNISPEKAVQLIPKIQEKIRLEDELNKADDSLKPAVEEQIAAVSEEIRQDAGIKTAKEKAVEDQEKLVQEKEIADLNMLSTMGVITPEQQTRLNELNAKAAMAPAEATGVETKTTADATQERIIEESRKQQYQDVEEGGLPPEASRRDITEQGGKVEEEKVSSKTTPVEEAAAAVQRSLESAGITVRTLTEEEAVAEGYSDRTQGMFEDKKGQIVVVPSRIQEGWGTTVVWHEGAHPVLNIVRNTDKPTYDAMVRGLKNLAQNATGKNKAQLDDVVKFAEEYRAERGQEGVDDESIAEFTGRVGSGMIDIDALPKSFKQKFVDFINSMATKLGLGTVMKDTDAQTLINKAKQISDVLKSGRDVAEVVGAENLKKFEAAVPGSEIISGEINRDRIGQARIITSPIESVYEEKETVKLPTRSLEDVLDQFNDKISVINSDATKVGWVTLPSGKEIFLYGGPGFLSIKDNVDNGIGFASTEISKVKMAMNLVKEVNDGGTGVIMIGVQNPKSTFGNSYSVEYVFDAIGQLPKSVLSSSEFRSEFFGEDIVAIKQAIGEDRYKKFVDKYRKADFSSPEVFSSVSSELINNLSGVSPDTFKARRAIVEQLIAGIGVKNPKKFISKSLYSNFGINAEKVLYELGVKEIVDLYLETGQWGLITSGFEVNPNADVLSFQDKGIKHPLFNAKFPGSNPFKLDGGYLLNELFERKYLGINKKGKPFYLESAQSTSQSMYHGGKLSEGMSGVTFAKLPEKGQESRGKRMDVVADTYVQSGLTEDGNDYVFFHVSSADEKSIRKGIDSRKFYSTRTSKSEKGTQYGVASYYTKPTDGERMVGGDKYVVRVSKDKVYPMDIDPKGYKDQVEKTVPENTPFRAEVIKKKMADLAAKDGYQMAVGEWYYSRTGEKTEMPEFRADALVALKPTNESASDFVSNEESGMERIAHPEEAKYKYAAQYEALGEAAYDYLSEKGRYDDAYDIARDMYMYGKVPTEQEMKTLMKGMPKKISNMAPKTGQQSMGQRINNLAPQAGSVGIGGDVRTMDDFDTFKEAVAYNVKRTAAIGIDESEANYGDAKNINEIKSDLEKAGIQVEKVSQSSMSDGNYASFDGDKIKVTDENIPLQVLLHEIGEKVVLDLDKAKQKIEHANNIFEAVTTYGASRGNDAFADNFYLYFLSPQTLKDLSPNVYAELDKLISQNIKDLGKSLMSKYGVTEQTLKYNKPKAVEQSLKETPKFDSNMAPKTGQQSMGQRINNLAPQAGSVNVGGYETFYTGRGKKYDDLKNTKGEFIFFSKDPKISEWYGGDESNVTEAKLDTSDFLDLTTQESKAKFVKEHFTDKDIEKLYSAEIKYEEDTDRFGRKTRESLIKKYRERAEENRFSGDGKEQQFLLKKIKEQGHSGVKLLDTHFGKSDISYVVIDKSKIEQSLKETPKFDSNMAPKTGQQSMGQRMNVAGIEYTELSIAAQETLRARRSKKSYFDDAVSKMPKSDFDKDEVERIIKEENFGIITGENPMGTPTVSSVNSKLNGKAVKWLESRGYEVAPVTGKYGQTENSFFVPGLTVADAVEFAKAFNQDSVVTNEGMVYQDGRMNPRTMNDSFNVDSSSPTEDFVSAIRTEDGNVMGFKIGIDLETKVDSSYVAQSAVDTKSTEYAKSSVDKAISERADAKVQDDADTLSAINTTAEEAKSSSIINGPTKISQLKDQVVKAVEDGLISDATAKKVVDDAIKSYDEKVAASKESIKEAIDKAKDVISKFLFNPEGQYVTNPETGEKVKISKSSIFDVEATVNFATDAIKKAVDKGVDLAVALGNFKSALSNHPTIKNNIANNVITEGEFEAMLDAEIAKLTQLYNNLNNKKTEKASKTLDRVMRSNFVSQDIKDSLESQGITYVPDTISASVSDAQAIVDYFDAEGALDILEENMANVAKSPDVMPHTRALILAEIFDKRLKVADDVANDPSSSDQAKKAAADKAANTAIAFSTINGQYAKSVSIASKRMKEIVGMSAKGLEYFVDAQVKMKSKNFVKSNRMQRKAKKAMVNAAKTGNASDSKKSIMDSLMPEYSKLDDKFKTAIDANLSNAINSNGQINKKDLENALVAYYSGMQMSEDLKKSILSHTAAIKDMEGKQKSFSKIIEEYKSALSGLDPGSPAYKAVVDKYEKMAEDAAEAVRDADFKARLEAEIMGRKMREGRDLWQSLASIMKLNMLTPQTIIVNIVGYLPAIALRGAAVTIATPIDWSITMAMKATRSITGNKTEVSRTTRVVRDAFGGIKYGFAYGAKEGFRKIVYGSTSEDVEKYNMKHSMNAFQAWRDLFSKKSPVELNNVENKISAFIEATFGMPADAMSRMLSIGDKIPFEISKASKLSSLANEIYVKNKDGSQRKMNNAERLEFIFNPPAEAAQIANDFAEKMTYQQKNILSDMVNKAQKHIAIDVSGFIEGSLGRHISGFANLLIGTVIPFTKTPVNLLTETFMFTNPALGVVYSAGYAAKSVKEERAGNEFKASYYRGESIRYFSRATVAMGVAMVAANMIKNGLMTGDEDEMKFDAKSMQYENVRARSLNLSALFRMNTGDSNWAEFRKGDFMIDYSKLGTLGLGLSAWADFYRDKDANQIDGGLNDIMSLEGLGGISLANIKAMVDQSFMTGIAGVIDAIRDDQGNEVKKFMTNTVVGLSKIFIPNTVSAVSKASMDFTKETRTEGKDTELSDMIMNRLRVDLGITGSADELPSKITLWGEPVKSSPAGTNPWVYYLFDPVRSYSPDTESVGFKIQQSYFATPKSMSNVRNKMIPSKPDQTISINNSNVMLTGSEYEQYQILVGKTRKSMVSSYVNSDLWNQSSLEQRAEVLDSLYSQAAKIARVQFIMNTPRLMDINMGVK